MFCHMHMGFPGQQCIRERFLPLISFPGLSDNENGLSKKTEFQPLQNVHIQETSYEVELCFYLIFNMNNHRSILDNPNQKANNIQVSFTESSITLCAWSKTRSALAGSSVNSYCWYGPRVMTMDYSSTLGHT